MSGRKSDPPGLAVWWLRHAWPGGDNEALTGDLIERFREGQTRGWFWRQVFIAFAVGVLGVIRRRWPLFGYAAAMTVAIWLLEDARALRGVPGWVRWRELAFPWSQIALELSRPVLLSLAVLPVLAAGLAVERSFRWTSLLWTEVLSLAVITFGHYSINLFPWLLRPVPRNQNLKFVIIPVTAVFVLSFFSFLAAAWVGCLAPSRQGVVEAQR